MSDVAEARKKNKEILPEQAEIIERYGKYLRGSGIAETTLANKINKISQFALKINKPFNDITREDLENYLDNLYSEISARTERKLKSSTLCVMKSEIKQFFRWLKNSDDYPPIVKWINTGMATSSTSLKPEEVLSPEETKIKCEYKPTMIVKHMRECPPDVFAGVIPVDFLDDRLRTLESDHIRKTMYKLIDIFFKSDKEMDGLEKEELRKSIYMLDVLQELAEHSHIEIEIISMFKLHRLYEYNITLKPSMVVPKIESVVTFYLEGTPFPPNFYNWWLGIDKDNLDCVTLPSDAKVTIIYEDAKRITSDFYGRGDKSEPFLRLLKLIKGLQTSIEKAGMPSAVVARTKDVSTMLGSNGIHVDYVCGDTEGEGVQLDKDVVILEGTQIRNISVDVSRKFRIARVSRSRKPKQAISEYQNIINSQTMIQASFRGIDRENNRGNFIVLLGNQMPFGEECWIELAKQYWSYLESNNVRYVKINGRQMTDNEIKEIIEVITNKNYDYNLSPYENHILRYIEESSGKYTRTELFNWLKRKSKTIKRTKQEILLTINKLIEMGRIEVGTVGSDKGKIIKNNR